MKIIHIILGKANPDRMNGVNKVVNSLATAQAHLDYQAEVWGITHSLEKNYPGRNYTTRLFRAHKNKWRLDHKLIEAIQNVKEGVFHIHGGFIPEFFHVARYLKTFGKAFIYTPHGAYNAKAMRRNKWIKKVYFQLFEKYISSHSYAVHSIGLSEELNTQKLVPGAKTVLIPNGQHTQDLIFEASLLKKNSTPVFGFIGRIDIETKGLDLLLEAFAIFLSKNQRKGELWIIGGGGEMDKLKQMARKLEIMPSVVFWDQQFGPSKLNIMSQADAFFQPSRNEGLPGSVLEACGLGVPCVVSKESNMAGYIHQHQAGIGMECNDVQHISNAMRVIRDKVEDQSILQWKRNAVKMVESEFDWGHISRSLMEVYQSAVDRTYSHVSSIT